MKRLIILLSLYLTITTVGFSQKEAPLMSKRNFFVTGGIGTSWIILPKVFLVDENDISNNWQILPATNHFTAYIGFATAIPLSEHWLFTPEIDINYISGQIRVDENKTKETSQKLQTYARIEIPLNFGILSTDNFWATFGPVVYFTLYDNKGFDDAVNALTKPETNPNAPIINSDDYVGLRFRLAAYINANRYFISIKFDSDLFAKFEFVDDEYRMRMSMQSITLGLGWRTSEAR